MNLPWLMLQWKSIERERLQNQYDWLAASGGGAIAAKGEEAVRIWSRNLSKLQERIKALHYGR